MLEKLVQVVQHHAHQMAQNNQNQLLLNKLSAASGCRLMQTWIISPTLDAAEHRLHPVLDLD